MSTVKKMQLAVAKREALDWELDEAVVAMAKVVCPSGFDAADEAPSSFAELKAHMQSGQRMRVWSGASDFTIFGSPEVNHASRAWHDYHHYTGGHDFTIPGEAATVLAQVADLKLAYGDHAKAKLWRALLFGDIIGLSLYGDLHDGVFPIDQRRFVRDFVRAVLPEASE